VLKKSQGSHSERSEARTEPVRRPPRAAPFAPQGGEDSLTGETLRGRESRFPTTEILRSSELAAQMQVSLPRNKGG